MKPNPGVCWVIYGNKGGTGKSMIAAHLAVFIRGKGHPTLVLDLDARQGDAIGFFQKRKGNDVPVLAPATPEEMLDLIKAYTAKGFDIVVDCPPADTPLVVAACKQAAVLVMPFRPGANDARALGRALRMATQLESENRGKLCSVVNFLKTGTRDSRAIVGLLQTADLFNFAGIIGDRTAFNDALRRFKTAWEDDPASKAAEEALEVCSAIYSLGRPA